MGKTKGFLEQGFRKLFEKDKIYDEKDTARKYNWEGGDLGNLEGI